MSTPPIDEGQLRDVLARVVPEAPDSVADPAPVVRAARTRRRAQVAVAGGAVAVIAVAAVVGGRALTDDPGPQVAGEPSLPGDPYSAAACPEVLPESGPLPDLADVQAVRYCAAGFNGFPTQPGPPDALLDGIDGFAVAVAALPEADPARCAAVDVIPSDSRLAFELADGTLAFVPATMCTDVTVDGHKVDGAELTSAFVVALSTQRDLFDYEAASVAAVACDETSSVGPARPGREHLVSAMVCGSDTGVEVAGAGLQALDEAWSAAEEIYEDDMCVAPGPPPSSVVARTDRGDVVQLTANHCGSLDFYANDLGPSVFQVPVNLNELSVS